MTLREQLDHAKKLRLARGNNNIEDIVLNLFDGIIKRQDEIEARLDKLDPPPSDAPSVAP